MIDDNASVPQLAQEARDEFRRHFGSDPRWITAAPGRVNLIGEHTDYNDGFVLPMAIERYVLLAAGRAALAPRSNAQPGYRLHSMTTGEMESWPADGCPARGKGDWTSYVWGVLDLCQQRQLATGPLDIVVHSSVPVGGGLSSSAALEVATATLVEAITGQILDPVDKALLCQKAEHVYAGVPCGIMDQFSSVMGRADHLILLDCRSAQAELVPLNGHDVSVLITNTNVKHELTGGEYAERRRQCEEAARHLNVHSLRDCTLAQLEAQQSSLQPVLLQRARHVVGEIHRTTQAAEAFRSGHWERVGELMYASHHSLKNDYQVSCAELDLLVELAGDLGVAGGVYGSRMTGGGFGGCTVSLVESSQVASIAQQLLASYQAQTGIRPTMFLSRPAEGARVVAS
ncbi:MAG: galactokinase [Pirellulaceae bacterium]